MGKRVTPADRRKVVKLAESGMSEREICERTGLSKGTVGGAIREAKARRSAKDGAQNAPAEEPTQPSPPVPAQTVDDLPPLTMMELRDWVSKHIRGLQLSAERCEAAGDQAGAAAARRLLTAAAPLAARITPEDKDPNGEYTEVRTADLEAASLNGQQKLAEILERMQAERSTWPTCARCGQPVRPAKEACDG